MSNINLKFNLHKKKIFAVLFSINIFITVVCIFFQIAKYMYNLETPLTELFDLNQELNVPTWYSGILFFSCALTSYLISILGISTKDSKYWKTISVIFIFLSLDEVATIHERINKLLSMSIDAGGYLYFKWFILYVPIILIIGILLIPFFKRLDKKLLKFLFVSGTIFVIGAVGVEILGGKWADIYGQDNFIFFIFTTIEEFLELLGLTIFIYGTVDYIESKTTSIINLRE